MKIAIALLSLGVGISFGQTGLQGPMSGGRSSVLTGTGESTGDRLLTLRPYISLLGTYETGLAAPTVSSDGKILSTNSYGASANLGVSGMHEWRRTVLGINYHGSYQDYSNRRYLNGFNNTLVFGVSHTITPHVKLSVVESAGTSTGSSVLQQAVGNFSLIPGMGTIVDPNGENIPGQDIINVQSYYSSTSADLTVIKSARLSYNLGGSGFLVRRRASGFANLNGAAARADVGYALTRRQTIGLQYFFSHFGYTKGYGSGDVHGVGFYHNFLLTPHLQVGYTISGYRFESLMTANVAVDPVVAEILGSGTSMQILHGTRFGGGGDAHLVYDRGQSQFVLSAARRISPGSGVYLASQQQVVQGGWQYSGFQRFSMGVSGSYRRLGSLMQSLNSYTYYTGGVGMGYRLFSLLHLTGGAGVGRYEIAKGGSERTNAYVRVGLAFTFNEIGLPGLF